MAAALLRLREQLTVANRNRQKRRRGAQRVSLWRRHARRIPHADDADGRIPNHHREAARPRSASAQEAAARICARRR